MGGLRHDEPEQPAKGSSTVAQKTSLGGQRALITGGSRGIGRSIAQRLAACGADIGIVGRDRSTLEATRALVELEGRDCAVIEGDLATFAGARSAGGAALAYAEKWDILVNNAGIVTSQPLLEIDGDDWDAILGVNVRAAVALAQVVVPGMVERRSGKVINVSSVGAFLGTPGLAAYAASKAALNQLTRTMAVEWGPFNVQANAVCPTIILTDMARDVWDGPDRATERRQKEERIPMHRFGEPGDVAELVAFLASPAADYLNGLSIPVDGGMLAAP